MDKASTPADQILPMIERRIRASIREEVEQTRKHLESVIGAEMVKLGFHADFNKSWQFASEVATEYGETLVGKRIKAIVDGLVSEPAKVDAAARAEFYGKAVADAAAGISSAVPNTALGIQVMAVRLYQWTDATPNTPIGTSTLDWQTGFNVDYDAADGWSIACPPAPGPGQTLYVAGKIVSAAPSVITQRVGYAGSTLLMHSRTGSAQASK
jgi:hypothetical protein